jgi:hypothetical protein
VIVTVLAKDVADGPPHPSSDNPGGGRGLQAGLTITVSVSVA